MSTLIIKNATIADPGNALNGEKLHIFIENGVIKSISDKGDGVADQVVDAEGYYVSCGWIDTLAYCGEPGEEWKEDLNSLAAAAAAGGYTSVAAFCGNHPYPDKASAIASLVSASASLPCNILPYGTATKGREGKEISEMFDMKKAGAVGFFDGDSVLCNQGLKSRLLEYAKNCDVPLMLFPFNSDLAPGGMMHDGVQSNSMGLKGIPSICETAEVNANLELAAWLNTPLRLARISTAGSVERIRTAKKEGIQVTAITPAMNLLFTDSDLAAFDENYKVLPPLRTETDRMTLVAGLLDGTLDAVCSNHKPEDTENKDVEFEYAAFGAATIQNTFHILVQALGDKVTAEKLAQWLTHGPRKYLGLDATSLKVGEPADLTLMH
jgi:dihydroorotase